LFTAEASIAGEFGLRTSCEEDKVISGLKKILL
jgi:hypothetical protein